MRAGYFPLEAEVCVLWVSSDVLMCTASIWHMCTMSMDRYFTLKYPMRYGRNKTKTMVVIKIFFVWIVSMAISSPICIHGFVDPAIVYNDGVCVPVLQDFVIYGSVFAFYVPLLIMIVTYVLTIHILWKNQRHMQNIHQADLRSGAGKDPASSPGFSKPKVTHLVSPAKHLHADRPTSNGAAGGVDVSPPLPTSALLVVSPTLSSQPSTSLQCRGGGSGGGGGQACEGVQGGSSYEGSVTSRVSPRREETDSDEEEVDLPSTCLLQVGSWKWWFCGLVGWLVGLFGWLFLFGFFLGGGFCLFVCLLFLFWVLFFFFVCFCLLFFCNERGGGKREGGRGGRGGERKREREREREREKISFQRTLLYVRKLLYNIQTP